MRLNNERLIASQHNAQAFTVAWVLVQHEPDDVVHQVQSKESYVSLSRYLSWLFRNSGLFQKDGSLTLSELLCLPQLQRHLKEIKNGRRDNFAPFKEEIFQRLFEDKRWKQSRSTIEVFMPLAMVLAHNNKGRFQIGFIQGKHLRPDITGNRLPSAVCGLQCPAEAWSTFCNFDSDEIRANEKLIPQDAVVERVYVRAISGHGKRFTWLDLGNIHRRFKGEQPTVAGWLVHGTQEYHLSSIRREGLRAGGRSGSRKHNHLSRTPNWCQILWLSGGPQMFS